MIRKRKYVDDAANYQYIESNFNKKVKINTSPGQLRYVWYKYKNFLIVLMTRFYPLSLQTSERYSRIC
jgi:hypothetical protein